MDPVELVFPNPFLKFRRKVRKTRKGFEREAGPPLFILVRDLARGPEPA